MSPAWMLQTLLAGTLVGVGALALERVAGWFAVPRRAVWAAAMLVSLALPALALWAPGLLPDPGIVPDPTSAAPGVGVPFPFADAATGPLAAAPSPDAVAWWRDLSTVLGLGWLASSLAVLGAVAWTYRRLRAVRAGSVPMELDGTAVRVAERTGPAVVGLLRPAVVVPRWTLDLPAEERRLILLHEREHVAHGDPWLLFLGTLAVAAMPWCLPLWWQHRRLRSATETDCDARVLARGASRRDYGHVLIRTAGCTPVLPLLGPAWGDSTSQLERRIMTMTAKRPSHRALRAVPLLALTAGVVAAACDVAGERGPAAPPEPASSVAATTPKTLRAWRSEGRQVVTDTVLVDSVTVSRSGPPPTSSTGLFPVFPVSLDPTVTLPRVRTLDHFTVGEMREGGGASKAGIRVGDVILTINGQDSREMSVWKSLMNQRPGTRYVLRVRRGSEEREITARLDPPYKWHKRSR